MEPSEFEAAASLLQRAMWQVLAESHVWAQKVHGIVPDEQHVLRPSALVICVMSVHSVAIERNAQTALRSAGWVLMVLHGLLAMVDHSVLRPLIEAYLYKSKTDECIAVPAQNAYAKQQLLQHRDGIPPPTTCANTSHEALNQMLSTATAAAPIEDVGALSEAVQTSLQDLPLSHLGNTLGALVSLCQHLFGVRMVPLVRLVKCSRSSVFDLPNVKHLLSNSDIDCREPIWALLSLLPTSTLLGHVHSLEQLASPMVKQLIWASVHHPVDTHRPQHWHFEASLILAAIERLGNNDTPGTQSPDSFIFLFEMLDSVWWRACQDSHSAHQLEAVASGILKAMALQRFFMMHHDAQKPQSSSAPCPVSQKCTYLIARLLCAILSHATIADQEQLYAPFVQRVVQSITVVMAELGSQTTLDTASHKLLASRLSEVGYLFESFTTLFSFATLTSTLGALLDLSLKRHHGLDAALSGLSLSLLNNILMHSDRLQPSNLQLSSQQFSRLLQLIVGSPSLQAAVVLSKFLQASWSSEGFFGKVDVYASLDKAVFWQLLADPFFRSQQIPEHLARINPQHSKLALEYFCREVCASKPVSNLDAVQEWLPLLTIILTYLPASTVLAQSGGLDLVTALWPLLVDARIQCLEQTSGDVDKLLVAIAARQIVPDPAASAKQLVGVLQERRSDVGCNAISVVEVVRSLMSKLDSSEHTELFESFVDSCLALLVNCFRHLTQDNELELLLLRILMDDLIEASKHCVVERFVSHGVTRSLLKYRFDSPLALSLIIKIFQNFDSCPPPLKSSFDAKGWFQRVISHSRFSALMAASTCDTETTKPTEAQVALARLLYELTLIDSDCVKVGVPNRMCCVAACCVDLCGSPGGNCRELKFPHHFDGLLHRYNVSQGQLSV